MYSASVIRFQVESALARKIPSALTPQPKIIRPVIGTGIMPLDDLLRGGLPVGAISELHSPFLLASRMPIKSAHGLTFRIPLAQNPLPQSASISKNSCGSAVAWSRSSQLERDDAPYCQKSISILAPSKRGSTVEDSVHILARRSVAYRTP